MMRAIRVSLSFLTAAALIAAAGAPPKLRLSEVQQIQPTGYRVELSLDPAKSTFSGSIRIRVVVGEATRNVWLNANQIAVDAASVTAGGRKYAAVSRRSSGGSQTRGYLDGPRVPAGTYSSPISSVQRAGFAAINLLSI